jgi:uncharacterized protein
MQNGAMRVPPLPMELDWLADPVRAELADGSLTIEAGAGTDWFRDPGGRPPSLNAPALVGPQAGPFRLSARVTVGFGATYDAGGLVAYADEARWAKLCLEYSPQNEAAVVSVVTRGASDDCTASVIQGGALWLRVQRLGPDWTFHTSCDGRGWTFVRHFELGETDEFLVGFLAQSPTGRACSATFDHIGHGTDPSAGLRDGS